MRENKSGLQTKIEGNTSTMRGTQRNIRNIESATKRTENETYKETNYKITTA